MMAVSLSTENEGGVKARYDKPQPPASTLLQKPETRLIFLR